MERLTLLGNGKMAFALAKGLQQHYKIHVAGRSESSLIEFCSQLESGTTFSLLPDTDLSHQKVILCVKPYALQEVADQCLGEPEWLVSILAGTSLESIQSRIKAKAYVRAMPNVAASFQQSATTLTGDTTIMEETLQIFNCIGKAIWVDSEKMLDIATALAGSGPAYLALVAESLIDGAVREGLPRPQATELTQGLFSGFSALLANENATQIKESVMSPGGTTAAGIGALEENATRSAFMEAIAAAYAKALSLK